MAPIGSLRPAAESNRDSKMPGGSPGGISVRFRQRLLLSSVDADVAVAVRLAAVGVEGVPSGQSESVTCVQRMTLPLALDRNEQDVCMTWLGSSGWRKTRVPLSGRSFPARRRRRRCSGRRSAEPRSSCRRRIAARRSVDHGPGGPMGRGDRLDGQHDQHHRDNDGYANNPHEPTALLSNGFSPPSHLPWTARRTPPATPGSAPPGQGRSWMPGTIMSQFYWGSPRWLCILCHNAASAGLLGGDATMWVLIGAGTDR